jgi:hypothetical protein
MEEPKQTSEIIEHAQVEHAVDDEPSKQPVMRAKSDDLSVWQTLSNFKFISLVAMAASFSASLDGYRKNQTSKSYQPFV